MRMRDEPVTALTIGVEPRIPPRIHDVLSANLADQMGIIYDTMSS